VKMEESQSVAKSSFLFGLETSAMAKCALIAAGSFISTIAITGMARNNFGMTALITAMLFLPAVFAIKVAKAHIRRRFTAYGLLVIPPAMAAILMMTSLKPVAFTILFLLHALACLFLRTLKNTARIGIELIMLITVLGSFVYGAKAGAMFGVGAMLMDYALTARLSYFAPLTIGAYALTGLLASSFSGFGITAVGIWATAIYNIITSFIIVTFMGGQPDKCLRFGISNIALNAALFATVAPWLLSMLT